MPADTTTVFQVLDAVKPLWPLKYAEQLFASKRYFFALGLCGAEKYKNALKQFLTKLLNQKDGRSLPAFGTVGQTNESRNLGVHLVVERRQNSGQ